MELTDLVINKTVSYKFDHNVVNWTVVVTNYGPQILENVTVKDIIPVGLINVSVVRNDGGSFVGCVWSVGDLLMECYFDY